jgi:hypothetical protein
MEALVASAPNDPRTFKAVFNVAKTYITNRKARNFDYDNLPVGREAVKLLGNLGQKAPGKISQSPGEEQPAQSLTANQLKELIALLREARLDRNQSMRDAATTALKQIENEK